MALQAPQTGSFGKFFGFALREGIQPGEIPGMKPSLTLRGLDVYRSYLDRAAQEALVNDIRGIVTAAPLFSPETRWGKKMSVRMTSAGRFGWISDRSGYRYARQHPNGVAWPPIPARVLDIWKDLADSARLPECCLVNWYGESARMGLHQDRDEVDFSCPVVSLSLGDEGLFRVGTDARKGPTESFWLRSGDVVVMGGAARLTHHGVDRIRFGSSTLLAHGGRINLTLRVVT